jgi:hypothetical protein
MNDRVIPYLSLTEVVEDYMISNLNNRQKLLVNYLVHAKWIWKKLLWNTVWQTVSQYVKVKVAEDGQLYIDVPKGTIRVLSLCRVDGKGRLRPFVNDDNISSIVPNAANGVVCDQCGESDDLGACISGMTVITEQVLINDVPYVNKTWKKLEKNGDLLEIREVWAMDVSDPNNVAVRKATLTRRLCSMEVKPCGCLVSCEVNEQLVQLYCSDLCRQQKQFLASGKDWAKIKVVEGRIYFSHRGRVPDFVVLTTQTNGECGEAEMMIPEYAVEAVTFGIHWRAGALAPASVVSPGENRERKQNWKVAEQELQQFLNPIQMQDFMDSQMQLPKWGAMSPVEEDCIEDLPKPTDMKKNCLTEADVQKLIAASIANLPQSSTPTVLQGPPGPKGDPGGNNIVDLDYHHDQAVAAQVWVINHGLGFEPSGIVIKNKSGVELIGYTVEHLSANQTVITHGFAIAGDATLS